MESNQHYIMKTYHVFIASSLSFQKERDLMEKVLTERNNSELNIVVHRHEKNGDNDLAKGDTQEIINSEIRRKRLLNYILCIRFFIEVHSIVSASRFFHMPTYLRVVIECQSRFFPFFPAFSRNCPDYFLHTSGSSSFRSLSDLGAR